MKQHSGMLFCNSPRNVRYLPQSLLDTSKDQNQGNDGAFSSCLIFEVYKLESLKNYKRNFTGGTILASEPDYKAIGSYHSTTITEKVGGRERREIQKVYGNL